MPIEFTDHDIAEARRVNRRLAMLPRFRMQTSFGRLTLNALLRLVELYPDKSRRDPRIAIERRRICANGRDVRLRIIRTKETCRGVVLDIHGGGFTIGNARMNDGGNARLALEKGFTIVSVDYRLALGRPVEELVEECVEAALWIFESDEFGRAGIVLCGQSAGATLAAGALLRLRDRCDAALRFKGVVLCFGLYDFAGLPGVREAGSETLLLHGPTIRTTLRKLTPGMTDEERRSPALSPLYADLQRLPPALFVVGAEDPLCGDSIAMEARWRAANSNSQAIIAPASPHAFDRLPTAIARKIGAYVGRWIEERLTYSADHRQGGTNHRDE